MYNSTLSLMVPLIIGDRDGLYDEYAASNRVPGLWFGPNDNFMVSTGLNNENYFQTFYPYEISKKYRQVLLHYFINRK